MEFAYLFIEAVFDILSTPLFQHFLAALLVLTAVSFTFSFLRAFTEIASIMIVGRSDEE